MLQYLERSYSVNAVVASRLIGVTGDRQLTGCPVHHLSEAIRGIRNRALM